MLAFSQLFGVVRPVICLDSILAKLGTRLQLSLYIPRRQYTIVLHNIHSSICCYDNRVHKFRVRRVENALIFYLESLLLPAHTQYTLHLSSVSVDKTFQLKSSIWKNTHRTIHSLIRKKIIVALFKYLILIDITRIVLLSFAENVKKSGLIEKTKFFFQPAYQ